MTYPPSKSRVVMYSFQCDDANRQIDCEKVLSAAKDAGLVTNYDDGRDSCPWFEAPPGKAARRLRDSFLKAGYTLMMRFEEE